MSTETFIETENGFIGRPIGYHPLWPIPVGIQPEQQIGREKAI